MLVEEDRGGRTAVQSLAAGTVAIGVAQMGEGLHRPTFPGLLDITSLGMNVEEAINALELSLPSIHPKTSTRAPDGHLDRKVPNGAGYGWREMTLEEARWRSGGQLVVISRSPKIPELNAASHDPYNSDAVAY